MHIQTNRWTEVRTGSRYAGCVGYDDPVYENYEYTANVSERVVIFDDASERKAFHKTLVKLKSKAMKVVGKVSEDSEAWITKTYNERLTAYKKLCEQIMHDYVAAPWYKKIFMNKEPDGYQHPLREEDIRRSIRGKAFSQVDIAKWILKQPNDYKSFTKEIYEEDYTRVINFIKFKVENVCKNYRLSDEDE